MSVYNEVEAEQLRALHVSRAFFLQLDMPEPIGTQRYHTGYGEVEIGGHTWFGVGDPIHGRLVSIEPITQPAFDKAIEQRIVLSGANAAFVRSVRDAAQNIEGAPAVLSFALFDPESEAPLTDLKFKLKGRVTAPIRRRESGVSQILLTIESQWSALNFPGAELWTGADHRRRYPGSKGLDQIGVDIAEVFK